MEDNSQPSRRSWVRRFTEAVAADRRKRPYLHADPDVFFVENAAQMLGCSVDEARRIPRTELPAHRGPGKRLLYLRDDVMRYVRSRRIADAAQDRSSTRPTRVASAKGVMFDPGETIRRLQGEQR